MTEVFHLVALRFISLCSAKGKIRKDQIDKSFVSQRFVKTWRQWTRLYSSNTHKQFNTMSSENTLEAQWVGLHDLTAKDAGSIPGWGNSCKSLSMAKKKKMSTNFDEASSTVALHSPSLFTNTSISKTPTLVSVLVSKDSSICSD